jgi:hypothetical protein
MVHAHPQESTQPRPLRIVLREKIFLQKTNKKFLGQVLGLLVVLVPAQADVFVNRLPVGGDQDF